jgi:hypothetical protein
MQLTHLQKETFRYHFCTIDLIWNLLQWMYFWVCKKTWENIGMLLKKFSSKPTCDIPTLWIKKKNPIIKIISRWWKGGIGIRKGFGWASMLLWFTRLSKFPSRFYPQKNRQFFCTNVVANHNCKLGWITFA